MQIELVDERFKKFRQGLRREDQEAFEQLMRYARRQLPAGVMAASPNPFDTMAACMMIELQKQLNQALQRIAILEGQEREDNIEEQSSAD